MTAAQRAVGDADLAAARLRRLTTDQRAVVDRAIAAAGTAPDGLPVTLRHLRPERAA